MMSISKCFINNYNVENTIITKHGDHTVMNLSGRLLDQNPWWQDPAKIDDDRKIAEWNRTIRYKPKLIGIVFTVCSKNQQGILTRCPHLLVTDTY